MHFRAHARGVERRKGRDGEILAHRCAGRGAGRVPATAWRLWLHAGIRHRRDVGRCPRAAHLWRHQRDHERADREGAVMVRAVAHMAECGRLRREYFGQDEWDRSTLSDARATWHQAPEQGFTLRGHRLSSLYRAFDQSALTLMSGESPQASSCRKYSNPTPQPGATP